MSDPRTFLSFSSLVDRLKHASFKEKKEIIDEIKDLIYHDPSPSVLNLSEVSMNQEEVQEIVLALVFRIRRGEIFNDWGDTYNPLEVIPSSLELNARSIISKESRQESNERYLQEILREKLRKQDLEVAREIERRRKAEKERELERIEREHVEREHLLTSEEKRRLAIIDKDKKEIKIQQAPKSQLIKSAIVKKTSKKKLDEDNIPFQKIEKLIAEAHKLARF